MWSGHPRGTFPCEIVNAYVRFPWVSPKTGCPQDTQTPFENNSWHKMQMKPFWNIRWKNTTVYLSYTVILLYIYTYM